MEGHSAADPTSRRRGARIRTLVVAATVVTATAVALVAWPMLSLFFYLTFESLHPEAIGWDEKTAWRKCEGAIAGRIEWPEQHGARCEAMSLCANEAPLTPAQSAQLADENRRGGCEAF